MVSCGCHLQMLAKPFTKMSQHNWDRAPRNTNGVERINGLSKTTGSSPPPLYVAMQSLYEKDKVFAVQHLAATEGLKISYRDISEEARRAQTAAKAEARKKKHSLPDGESQFGPPDKAQHFPKVLDDDFSPPPKSHERETALPLKVTKGKRACSKIQESTSRRT